MGSVAVDRRAVVLVSLASWLFAASGTLAAAPGLDPGFGDGGVARAPFRLEGPEGVSAYGGVPVARQPDGKRLVAAQLDYGEGEPSAAVVARFDRRGRLDRSFGRRGRLRLLYPGPRDLLGGAQTTFTVASILVQRDGRIVLAGRLSRPFLRLSPFPPTLFALARLPQTARPTGVSGTQASWPGPLRIRTPASRTRLPSPGSPCKAQTGGCSRRGPSPTRGRAATSTRSCWCASPGTVPRTRALGRAALSSSTATWRTPYGRASRMAS